MENRQLKSYQVRVVEATIFKINQNTGLQHNSIDIPINDFFNEFRIPFELDEKRRKKMIDRVINRVINDLKSQYNLINFQPNYEAKGKN